MAETPFTYEQARAWLSSHPLEPDFFEFQLHAASLSKDLVPGMIEVLTKGPIELHRAAAWALACHRIGTKSYGSTTADFEYRLSGPGRNDERTVRPQLLKAADITEEAFIAVDPLRRFDEYPPLDFSLVGLSRCPGPKWVASFDGHPMFGVRSVYLAHSLEGGGLIVVKTAHRQRWDEHRGGSRRLNPEEMQAHNLEMFAYVLLLFMVDSAHPELQQEDLSSYNAGKGPFADSHAQGWQEWERATWRLGAKTLDARIFRFGDGWTGFSVDDPDRSIAVVAYNVTDTNVHLDEVDGATYDFDFDLPFTIKDLRGQVEVKPDVASLMRAHAKHPDHEAVISASP